jgi:hypothetical protein
MCCNNTLTHVRRIGLVSLPYPKHCIIVSTRLSTIEKSRKKGKFDPTQLRNLSHEESESNKRRNKKKG